MFGCVTCAEIKTGTEAATCISLHSADLADYRLLRKDFHFEVKRTLSLQFFSIVLGNHRTIFGGDIKINIIVSNQMKASPGIEKGKNAKRPTYSETTLIRRHR